MEEIKTGTKMRVDVLEILGDAFIGEGHWVENKDASIDGTVKPTIAESIYEAERDDGETVEPAIAEFEEYTMQCKLPAAGVAALAEYSTASIDLAMLMRGMIREMLKAEPIGSKIIQPITARISFDIVDNVWDTRFAIRIKQGQPDKVAQKAEAREERWRKLGYEEPSFEERKATLNRNVTALNLDRSK